MNGEALIPVAQRLNCCTMLYPARPMPLHHATPRHGTVLSMPCRPPFPQLSAHHLLSQLSA